MNMRMTGLFLAILLTYSTDIAAQGDWELKRERKGITIYVREQEDNPLKEYRAQAEIPQPFRDALDFFTDLKRHPDWVFRCTGFTIIKTREDNQVWYHTTYDIPWPLKDRDLTVKAVIRNRPEESFCEMLTTGIHMDYPKKDGIVRMPAYREKVVLEKIDSMNTLFIAEGFTDPGGKVPPWLVNMFLVDGIYESVEKAREILREKEYQQAR